jgi:hypothetical protein
MAEEESKYMSLLNILRKSTPELTGIGDIEGKVLNAIQQTGKKKREKFNLFDYFFGWVYIRWVRVSLVTVSVFFIGLFIYQQSLILRRISILENQTIISGSQFVRSPYSGLEDKLILKRLSVRKMNSGSITITEKQLEKFADSYNELESKYKDLIKIIEDDPEMKRLLEEKLKETNKKKFNL